MKRVALLTGLILVLVGAMDLAAQNPIRVTGKVVDETGALMPSVDVKVFRGRNNTPVKAGKTNGEGAFDLEVPAGEYRLEVEAPDFDISRQTIKVAAGLKPLTIELKLAGVVVELEVSSEIEGVSVDPDSSVNGITMTAAELLDLPDTPDDLAAYLKQLSGTMPGVLIDLDSDQVEFMIDGLPGGELPPKEQIASIKIIEDLSAEGGRRIEIVTKAGTGPWHGNMTLGFRDSALNARQPLTNTIKPETQNRSYVSTFSGPIIQNKLGASFSLRSTNEEQGSQAIRAITPFGPFTETVVSPTETRTLSVSNMKWDFVPGKHSLTGAASYTTTRRENSGVNGFNLPERATNSKNRSWNFQLTQNSTLGKFVNVWRLQVRHENSETAPVSSPNAIVPGLVAVNVQDAFNGGSSQSHSLSRNTSFELTEQFTTTRGKWAFRTMVQLNRSHPWSESESNYQGTYTFPSLHDYCVATFFYGDSCQETLSIWEDALANGTEPVYLVRGAFGSFTEREITGVPTQFTQTVGDPHSEQHITTLRTQLNADWRKSQKLTISAVLRHQVENYLHHLDNLSPTLTLKYMVLPKTLITLAGNVNVNTFSGGTYETIRRSSAGSTQSNIVISNPTYVAGQAPYDGSMTVTPQTTTLRKLATDYQDPYNIQWQAQIARQFSRNITGSVTFSTNRGVHLAHYRNINAPYPGTPLPDELLSRLNAVSNSACDSVCTQATRDAARAEVNAMRPDPSLGNILQYESSGKSFQKVVSFGLRINNMSLFNLVRLSFQPNVNLRWSKDTPGTAMNSWDPLAEWGRAQSDQRLQFRTPLNINWFPSKRPIWQFATNFSLNVNSGRPYSITTGRDDNGDTSNNDRPVGVLRNSETGPSNYNVDMTFSKRFFLSSPQDRPRGFTAEAEPQRGGGGGGGFGGGGGGFGGGGGNGGNFGGNGGGNRGNGNGGSNGRRSVNLQIQFQNLFNNTQLRPPSGVVTSRFFGQSTNAEAGRRIVLSMQMSLF
jgi:hypothetical protein